MSVLSKQLMVALCSITRDIFVFQLDIALAHCTCDTMALMHFIAPDLWPLNSQSRPESDGLQGIGHVAVLCHRLILLHVAHTDTGCG